jgi:hypothetical protein
MHRTLIDAEMRVAPAVASQGWGYQVAEVLVPTWNTPDPPLSAAVSSSPLPVLEFRIPVC